jgi:hypothetical protein
LLEVRAKQLCLLFTVGSAKLLKLLFECQASFFRLKPIALLLAQMLNKFAYILVLPLLEHVADSLPFGVIESSPTEPLILSQVLLGLLLSLLYCLPSFTRLAVLLSAAFFNKFT